MKSVIRSLLVKISAVFQIDQSSLRKKILIFFIIDRPGSFQVWLQALLPDVRSIIRLTAVSLFPYQKLFYSMDLLLLWWPDAYEKFKFKKGLC